MSISDQEWAGHQHFEAGWWGDCTNTFGEDLKHPTYAAKMGLRMSNDGGRVGLEMPGMSIVDYGGGPSSMLLKTRLADVRVVVDPCDYPPWTQERYAAAGIDLVRAAGEDYVTTSKFDEAWCYNVLQHVRDPALVLANMRESARLIRVFEWINLPPHEGHPHELHSEQLVEWMGGISQGFWSEGPVTWDYWIGNPYRPGWAFYGYTTT